jgi:deoxyribose-phosphate aldolase
VQPQNGKRELSVREVAAMLDLLVLHGDASSQDVASACRTAAEAHLATVYCLSPMVDVAVRELDGVGVGVGTVVPGFDAAGDPSLALSQATRSLDEGASEIAVIVPTEWWRSRGDAVLAQEVRGLAELTASFDAALKVVFLTGGLDGTELVRGCQLAEEAGARILQGGSWFTADRSTLAQLQMMRAAAGPTVVVKGAGYIKSLDLLLLGYAHGLGRFNVQRVDRLLADAVHRSEGGELLVPPATDLRPTAHL